MLKFDVCILKKRRFQRNTEKTRTSEKNIVVEGRK